MDLTQIVPNYGQLAQLTPDSGIVPGGNPAGNIGTGYEALHLGEEQALHDQLMQKATGVADMQAQELQAGQPGRLANIQFNNSLAQGNLANLPQALSTQKDTADTAALTARTNKIKTIFGSLAPYAQYYTNSTDQNMKDAVIQAMKENGVKIGGKSVDEIPSSTLDSLMKSAQEASINTPELQQKVQVEKAVGDAWVARMRAGNEGKTTVALIQADSREKVANIYSEAKKQAAQYAASSKSPSTQQWYASMLQKMETNTLSQQEALTLMYYQKMNLAVATAKAGAAPPVLDPSKLPPGAPFRPAPTPVPPPIPGQQGQPAPAPAPGSAPPTQPAPTPPPMAPKLPPMAQGMVDMFKQRVGTNPASKGAELAKLISSDNFKKLDQGTQQAILSLLK